MLRSWPRSRSILRSGLVRVTRVVVAHDCGQIINPDGVRNQIEGNVIQGVSRSLKEEVTWDDRAVTSLTWETYPILTFPEIADDRDRAHRPAGGAALGGRRAGDLPGDGGDRQCHLRREWRSPAGRAIFSRPATLPYLGQDRPRPGLRGVTGLSLASLRNRSRPGGSAVIVGLSWRWRGDGVVDEDGGDGGGGGEGFAVEDSGAGRGAIEQ